MKIYIEDSVTPIYSRISQALGRALVMLGHEVLVVKRAGFNARTYADFVASQPESSVYIAGNEGYLINTRVPDRETYYFEQFPGKVIFIRHDAILGGDTLLDALAKLRAWKRVAARSVHLCLEPNNVDDLRSLGMSATFVPHVSEVALTEPSADSFEFDASFIGHVIPAVYSPPMPTPLAQRICNQAVQLRRERLDAPLEDMLRGHAAVVDGLGGGDDNLMLRIATTQWFRSQVIQHTLSLRGWLLENAGMAKLDIFGGDPAYIHRVDRNLTLDKPGIASHPAVYDTDRLKEIFNRSRVSINVTSLQFDHCVVNRFHDATMAGGLCLTDRRPGLADLTSEHAEISFNDVEQLGERVRYFTDPRRQSERVSLVKKIQADVMKNTGYDKLALTIQESVASL
jgi:hypothetical protein